MILTMNDLNIAADGGYMHRGIIVSSLEEAQRREDFRDTHRSIIPARDWASFNKLMVIKSAKSASSIHRNANKTRERKTGWTAEAYAEQELLQQSRCAICNRKTLGKKLHSDHKHVTPPQPRELLCGTCNIMLGMAKDNADILRAAANYIDKHNHISTRGTKLPQDVV